MKLTQERINEIALECWENFACVSHDCDPAVYEEDAISFAELFLSRLREEQEAVAWVYKRIGGYNEDRLVARMPSEVGGDIDPYPDTWERLYPLFTIPPAAPECKELVEALEYIKDIPSEGLLDSEKKSTIASVILAKHKASMGEKE